MTRFSSQRSLGLLAGGFIAGIVGAAGNAHAWLGGFEPNDGYQPFLNMVQNYNAGHYGPNSGYGGAAAAITPNTDFWTAVAGGSFSSSGAVSYATGHQWLDRQYVNSGIGSQNDQSLQLTTCHLGWGGPALEYTYNIDAPDLGGVNPLSTGGAVVRMSFWYRGALNGADTFGGVPEGYFGDAVEIRDSSNNVGLKLGITQRASGDKITFWNGSTLLESTIPAPEFKFDRWDLTIDLANDTFSADYYQFSTNTLMTLVTNQPLLTPLNDLSILDFRTSAGTGNDKHFGMNVDDFAFSVPEPSSIGAIGIAAASMLLRRRNRR